MNDIGKATRLTHTRSSERENNALRWSGKDSAKTIDIESAYSNLPFEQRSEIAAPSTLTRVACERLPLPKTVMAGRLSRMWCV
ncbi:MAG: hypothetical protein WA156_08050 [Methylocystis silviterrae]